jgi:hypothetical protein
MKEKKIIKLDHRHNNPTNEISEVYALLSIMRAIEIKELQLKQKKSIKKLADTKPTM